MLSLRTRIACIGLSFLAGCSLLADKPEILPASTAPTAPPAQPPEPDPLPYPPLPHPVSKPAPKPHPAPAAKSAKVLPGKSVANPPEAPLEARAEGPVSTAPASRSTRKAALATNSVKGPEWLQYCSTRQQSHDAILCDANTLLAQPSAKVQVYVREPALARDTPAGKIVLREGLPKLYRFFVLP